MVYRGTSSSGFGRWLPRYASSRFEVRIDSYGCDASILVIIFANPFFGVIQWCRIRIANIL